MITDVILTLFIGLSESIIGLLPVIDLDLTNQFVSTIANYGSMAFTYIGYFLPVNGLLKLMIAVITLDNWELILRIIYRIKSFIPTMGK